MLLELHANTNYLDKQILIERLENMGFRVVESDANILAVIAGVNSLVATELFSQLPNVAKVLPLTSNFKLASRQTKPSDTVIKMGEVSIGGDELFIIAGPCSIESREQLEACAQVAKANGAQALRGGAYKPRSSPYDFQGMSAEYIMLAGNPNVILCERGIRTVETFTRNTLDLNAIPALQQLTHLPVIADPSHGTGVRSLVLPMARASVAAGAHGILIEMHPDPDKSISDAKQTLDFETFSDLVRQVRRVKAALL